MAQFSVYRPWVVEPRSAFDELRRDLDAVFGRFGSQAPSVRRGVYPAANLYETTDAYVLTAELPGVSPDQIQISLEGSTVTLHGERKIDYAADMSAHRLERQSGTFRRAFDLPAAVDPDKVEAIHKNGVLELRLPKTPEMQPRQIAVQTG
ncbi:MAG: Hsp20/alpha crystallin family protein [Deltaproteobacteria bacterium]|jgi:HSP20 family protein|nr:Hsp20/alpha crystallin family protein [Deltaproteobacteria bacterium]MBW2543058.1 Hsp20/alpha crystallin family protein [Deltaproteobacteria bacterium]